MAVKEGHQQDGKIFHFSAGAIIERNGKYLLLDRAHFPLGFAGPAGHVDEGETPLQAVKREVKEETNLEVTEARIVQEQFLEWNECHHGVKGHYWYLFKCKTIGEPIRCQKETKSLEWYTPSEIKKLKLERAWKHWFETLRIL